MRQHQLLLLRRCIGRRLELHVAYGERAEGVQWEGGKGKEEGGGEEMARFEVLFGLSVRDAWG